MLAILIIILFLLLLLAIAFIRALILPKKTSFYEGSKDEERSLDYALKLQKMIQVETVSSRDNNDPTKFRKLHKVMEELFPTVFSTCEKHDIDGSLLVRWPGKDHNKQPIVLISHLDVVPAEGEWLYPPFSGTIVDGKIYGRGSFDVKCGVFSFYQAVEELIKEGYKPDCDIYLGSSCTEEIGGDGAPKIVKWFDDHNIRPFMVCDEGGTITEDPMPGVKGNFAAVGIFEKGYGDIKIIAKGNGGHSSSPGKNSPIARLGKFINEIETKPGPVLRQPFTQDGLPQPLAFQTCIEESHAGHLPDRCRNVTDDDLFHDAERIRCHQRHPPGSLCDRQHALHPLPGQR